MDASSPLVLNNDVRLIPATELDPETRRRIDCGEDEFAVSRLLGRVPSTVIDADGAALLERFRRPCTVVDAIVLFSRAHGRDPGQVLEQAHPLLARFVDRRFLVPAVDERGGLAPEHVIGERRRDFELLRLVHFLEDVEVYQVRRGERFALLKIERSGERPLGSLRHEADMLRRLDGAPAPELLDEGELDGQRYLLLEWCEGVHVETAAAEWRRRPGGGSRRRLHEICRAIATAYAELHRRGVLHGDVHPRNVLIDRHGAVRLVDFALARPLGEPHAAVPRGAVAFFQEPELAAAGLAGRREPAVSERGEQYAVAALCYRLVTGVHYLDFQLEEGAMRRQIVEEPPIPFARRNLEPWPRLEAVLGRALEKRPAGRFPSMAAFAEALDAAAPGAPALAGPAPAPSPLGRACEDLLAAAALDGAWQAPTLQPPPTASVNYGAAGLALALYRVASLEDDPERLALADLWAHRAGFEMARERGFYHEEIDITPEEVGESSPFHSPAGVWWVRAVIAAALAQPRRQARAVEAFIAASAGRPAGLDLTTGRAGTLLGAALLLDTLPAGGAVDRAPLLELGRRCAADLGRRLEAMPAIEEAPVEYLGIAHGWAGLLYALLQWARASEDEPASVIPARLAQLAALAEPHGRGLLWPVRARRHDLGPLHTPGWCNGSAGFVFLWCLAARLLSRPELLELALAAGWDAYDAADRYGSLCCGLAGRGWALLELHRETGDPLWLDRAHELAEGALDEQAFDVQRPHSLFKGRLGLAVLAADLRHPERSALPLFQEER